MTSNSSTEDDTHAPQPVKTLHLTATAPEDAARLDALIELIEPAFSDESLTVVEPDTPIDWDNESPCPACGNEELRVIRAREETFHYNADREELDYLGLTSNTAIRTGDPMHAFCPACDAVLTDTALHRLTTYDTL